MSSPFDKLAPLTRAAFQAQQARMQAIVAEEMQLRSELARLEEMRKQPGDATQAAIGADILWRGWLARRVTDINMQLAQVLARKEDMADAMRVAYARDDVVGTLAKHDRQTQRAARRVRATQDLMDLAMWSVKDHTS